MHRRQFALIALAVALVGPAVYSLTRPAPTSSNELTLLSGDYRLDKIYRSMEGPWSVQRNIQLQAANGGPGPTSQSSIVWITGIDTQVVDASRETPVSQEFFCHSNLTFADQKPSADKLHIAGRLFTLAPGRTSIELPPGFGVPIPADAPLDYVTMSLNLNPQSEIRNVRMRTTVHSIAADQPNAPTKPLFRRALYVLQRSSGSNHLSCNAKSMMSSGQSNAGAARTSEPSGLGCGEWTKVNMPDGSTALAPSAGMTNHWTVEPGRHVYTTEITPQLNLPFDTTIHYATIHVHPFARGMELRDLTTGQMVLHLNSQDWPDRLGVSHVDEFKSVEGIPILRGHRYELTTEYDNSSNSDTDAMAILYLYLLDKHQA